MLAVALARRAGDVCASPSLSSPAAEHLTQAVFASLEAARLDVFRALRLAAPPLPPRDQCAVSLVYIQIGAGFVLPALWQAAREARRFMAHQAARRAHGLAPQRGWQAAVYAGVAELLASLNWVQAALALGLLQSIAFDASQLLAVGPPPPPPATAA